MSYELATKGDDADIRRLLRENPMPGEISLSLEREPDAHLAAAIEGDVHQTILARHPDSRQLIAMGSVAVRDGYVNGELKRVGYLGQLRLDHRFRPRGSVIVQGYQFFRELLPMLGADVYFTSIAADNAPARRLLEYGLAGMPVYRPIDPFVTTLFPVQPVPRHARADILVHPGSAGDMVRCLDRVARRYNLVPAWREADLQARIDAEELRPLLASRDGRIVGCLGVCDQSAYKQTVVRGYSRSLQRWRPVINLVGPALRNTPHLPPVGTPLELLYLSHLAVDDDDPAVFAALLEYACFPDNQVFADEKTSYFVLGLSARHPLLGAIPRFFRRHTYRTQLYAVDWEGVDAFAFDDRPCQPEVALL